MKNTVLAISCFLLLSACAPKKTIKVDDFKELVSIMQGSYNSEKQSIQDPEYFNISLRMAPIWKDRGSFLYVEQALNDKQDKPYRVRIYRVTRKNNTEFVSEIYTIKNETAWIGKWKTPKEFDVLTMKDIELKPGCEVVLKKVSPGIYEGKTGDKTCASELRGASYASSIVKVTPTQIISWDQGFDSEGKQVWGAEKGGYVFDKISQ